MTAGLTTLLLLADGRFPAGGHAHSGGLESAVRHGRVRDVDDLRVYLLGRLATGGLVAAAFAAAVCLRPDTDIAAFEAALDARTPSPALRLASRRQGRSLCRAARVIWPAPAIMKARAVHHSNALGLVATAAGLDASQAAGIAAYCVLSGAASAAVRLLALDPYLVHQLIAALGADCDTVAAHALTTARGPIEELPAASAPLLDISAEDHAAWEVRLFAS